MKQTKDGKSTARLESIGFHRFKALCVVLGLNHNEVLDGKVEEFNKKHEPKSRKVKNA